MRICDKGCMAEAFRFFFLKQMESRLVMIDAWVFDFWLNYGSFLCHLRMILMIAVRLHSTTEEHLVLILVGQATILSLSERVQSFTTMVQLVPWQIIDDDDLDCCHYHYHWQFCYRWWMVELMKMKKVKKDITILIMIMDYGWLWMMMADDGWWVMRSWCGGSNSVGPCTGGEQAGACTSVIGQPTSGLGVGVVPPSV